MRNMWWCSVCSSSCGVRLTRWFLPSAVFGVCLLSLLTLGLQLLRARMSTYTEDGLESLRDDQDTPLSATLEWLRHPRTVCDLALSVGGSQSGGGQFLSSKIVCLSPGYGLPTNCTVYSVGHRTEWSFEEEMARFGCRVFAFGSEKDEDHPHDDRQTQPKDKRIQVVGIDVSDVNRNRYLSTGKGVVRQRTLETVAQSLGHEVVDVLRLDLPRPDDQWRVLADIVQSGWIQRVRHLCLHVSFDDVPLAFPSDWTRRLELLHKTESTGGLRFFSSRPVISDGKVSVEETAPEAFEAAWFRPLPNTMARDVDKTRGLL